MSRSGPRRRPDRLGARPGCGVRMHGAPCETRPPGAVAVAGRAPGELQQEVRENTRSAAAGPISGRRL